MIQAINPISCCFGAKPFVPPLIIKDEKREINVNTTWMAFIEDRFEKVNQQHS